ncbi:helicase-like protein [Limnobacter thiooxidans]|uniref:Helicase n=1 Tax=Limnobacter thiooxidans TaxID=131080 RepID=A0AA86JI81_9BURK|nr:helicase-like protein [Limnobacter thiooxidans]BET27621.1 hypothetical protein RGQ30_31220 [Limnobacter thiooxidans]
MGLFDFFRQKKGKVDSAKLVSNSKSISQALDGAHCYAPTEIGLTFKLNQDLSSLSATEKNQLAYLTQLKNEGYLISEGQKLVLFWPKLYELAHQPDHGGGLHVLGLPHIDSKFVPTLACSGSVSDPDFKVYIQSWTNAAGAVIKGSVNRIGGYVTDTDQTFLLSEPVWRVCTLVTEFSRIDRSGGGERLNQSYWADIRKYALQAGIQLDGFLEKTIVLKPDNLRIDMRKSSLKSDAVVEVIPDFDGAPQNWLNHFDRLDAVQDTYRIQGQDGSVTHVVVSPEIKDVLVNIKQMPLRRVAGESAMRFLKNPFSALGDGATQVVDPEQFEQSREKADILFCRFTIEPLFELAGTILQVKLLLQPMTSGAAEDKEYLFKDPSEFRHFVSILSTNFMADLPIAFWKGEELEISDLTEAELAGLSAMCERWAAEQNGQYFDSVMDPSIYGDRVVGIGEAVKITSPYIGKEGSESWLPASLLEELGTDGDLLAKFDGSEKADFDEFTVRISTAVRENRNEVMFPKAEIKLPLHVAKSIHRAWSKKFASESAGGTSDKPPSKRVVLLVQNNIEQSEYIKQRANRLNEGKQLEPFITEYLRPEVSLREHQLQGVAWMQHLFAKAPAEVSGCLLADDMGLGKTLQLLTLLVGAFEQSKDMKPALIIAPVSLLDNWERELQRFFHPSGVLMLKLYGEHLKAAKFTKHEIPLDLQQRGIKNLLRPGWLGEHKVVLATYETLRDMEFSLCRQSWSIGIFDEAQKIKNPAALVTQAAMALPCTFKVACTGTPVENSLTDLWCLFDLIQPSALGSLSTFGKTFLRPIENNAPDAEALRDQLKQLIDPQLLRRTKKDVAKDLPNKLIDQDCKSLAMGGRQRNLYEERISNYENQRKLLEKVGDQNAVILGLLHNLKVICAHPQAYQYDLDLVADSPKMKWMLRTLHAIKEKNEKAIIFTELRDIQRAIQVVLMDEFGLQAEVINGDTKASDAQTGGRQGIIDVYQNKPGFCVIILSTTAVGFGVNIQAANHVIHFTRPWNPAKEDQATDRAYRIGQTKDVTVYYPTITAEGMTTFEETLDRLLERKRGLATDMLSTVGDLDIREFVS